MNTVLNSNVAPSPPHGYIMNSSSSESAQHEYIVDSTQQQEYLVDQLYSRTNHNYHQNHQPMMSARGENGEEDPEYSLNQTNPFLPGFNNGDVGDDDDAKANQRFYYMDIEMALVRSEYSGEDSEEDDEDEDQRFGFSVMGGSDEGFPPTIDEVVPGSPADKADIDVGDEIIEVNGESLQWATHAHIISHIHQCIKSRTIKLRVKRNTSEPSNHLSSSSGGVGEVQHAYVIAVEDEARSRLETLSALHKVKAVNLASLPHHQEDPPASSESDTEKEFDSEAEEEFHEDEEVEESAKVVLVEGAHSSESSTEDVMMQHHQPLPPHYQEDVMDALAGCSDQENIPMQQQHREMAIDCPSGFVGYKKEPPRLPPQLLLNNSTSGGSGGSASPRGTPSKRRALDNTTNWGSNNYKPPPLSSAEEEHEAQMERIRKYEEDLRRRKAEEERIQREQDFLRTSLRGSKKLQELEESAGSPGGRLLQHAPAGIDNPNYVLEEEEDDPNSKSRASSATLPVRTLNYEGLIQQPLAVDDLFASLHRIESRLHEDAEDEQALLAPVQQLLRDPRFQNALHVHNRVVAVALRQPPVQPDTLEAAVLADTVRHAALPPTPYGRELAALLGTPHMEALFYTHDKVAACDLERSQGRQRGAAAADEDAEREYLYERASQYGEESIKIVHITKTADPLGATVRNEGDGGVVIGRIVRGGAAEASGLLHEGDEILEINGSDVRGRSVDDVCALMAGLTGTLTFLIVPHSAADDDDDIDVEPMRNNVKHRMMHVRAHFDYDPEDDVYLPCRELGLSFGKGDVLHVIAQDDPCWWQAYRDGEDTEHALAGLVPSRSFVETREAAKLSAADGGGGDSDTDRKKQKCRCRCRHRKKKKKKKKKMFSVGGEEAEKEEILTYEEVVAYYPQPNRKRPIVLIGAPYVGRHELRQRLMESDPDRFAAAVPYTTRQQKDDEVDGKHYHFVQRSVFEGDIADHKFVEYGEYEKNLYGTSIEAIRTVVTAGRICVLNLHPQSLRILKNSDLKPYIVFVAPPNIEKLKEIRIQAGAKISDSDLKDTIERAREMEDSYGHYFDFIIVNYDIERAYDELLTEINRLEVERQWVPAQWQA